MIMVERPVAFKEVPGTPQNLGPQTNPLGQKPSVFPQGIPISQMEDYSLKLTKQ